MSIEILAIFLRTANLKEFVLLNKAYSFLSLFILKINDKSYGINVYSPKRFTKIRFIIVNPPIILNSTSWFLR